MARVEKADVGSVTVFLPGGEKITVQSVRMIDVKDGVLLISTGAATYPSIVLAPGRWVSVGVDVGETLRAGATPSHSA